MTRGYFGVGIYMPKVEANVGTLIRSADLYGAAFVFTIGRRYSRQATDTMNTTAHTPLFHFDSIADARHGLPNTADIVAVELDPSSVSLPAFAHPERAVYLLGAEDYGIPEEVLSECDRVVQVPAVRAMSMNVATAGSIVLYDRHVKGAAK